MLAHTLRMRSLLVNPLFKTRAFFSKKPDGKKKSAPPVLQPKKERDYVQGPKHLKDTVLEVRDFQTVSQSFNEEEALSGIIKQQRQNFETALNKELEKKPDQSSIKAKLIKKVLKMENVKRYYLRRPLKSLQNILFSLVSINIISCGILEMIGSYSSLGWFFGCFTAPAAASGIAIVGGFNFAFWVVRHAFHLHLPSQELTQSNMSMVTAHWPSIVELSFTLAQLLGLFGTMAFGGPLPIHQSYLVLALCGGVSLIMNLRSTLTHITVPTGVYWSHISRILSQLSLLVLCFSFYYINVASPEPQNPLDRSQRISGIKSGYGEFLSAFKVKNYQMLSDEKINPDDGE